MNHEYRPAGDVSTEELRNIILARHLESNYIKLKAQKPKRDIYLHRGKEFIVGQLGASPIILHGNRREEITLVQELEKITGLRFNKVS